MERFQARYDAVIVGGGHNGLVAASYLARAGNALRSPVNRMHVASPFTLRTNSLSL